MEDARVDASAAAIIAAALVFSVMAGSAYAAGATPDIYGTYWATRYYAKLPIVGGGALPLTAMGNDKKFLVSLDISPPAAGTFFGP